MTGAAFDTKDPDDVINYTWDFSKFLATGESISSYSFPDFPAGLTLVTDSNTATSVTGRISGGTDGTTYTITCRAITDAGQTKDVAVQLPVAE